MTKRKTPRFLINDESWPGIAVACNLLKRGERALDVVENALREVESNPSVITVGFGGRPNLLGQVELDAAIMDADRSIYGAVGAIKRCPHPISLARQVLEKLPHLMLVGEGADLFADEVELSCSDNQSLLHPDALVEYQQFLADNHISREELAKLMSGDETAKVKLSALLKQAKVNSRYIKDTAVMIAYDVHGSCAVGTSTCGWFFKYPGRLGDSVIPGAGFYGDSKFGAATCTHTGENSMRCLTAKHVVDRLRAGNKLAQALDLAALEQNELRDGHLGELTIYGLTPNGQHSAVICRAEKGKSIPHYLYWEEGLQEPQRHLARIFEGCSA